MKSLYITAVAALLTAPVSAQTTTPSAQATHREAAKHKGHKNPSGASVNTTASSQANAGNGGSNPAGASSNSGGGLTSAGGNAGGHLSDDR